MSERHALESIPTQILLPIDSSAASAITLVTCYPFHFIGAALQRLVVHAYKE
jgi:sortase (surface protein transpeptidase)